MKNLTATVFAMGFSIFSPSLALANSKWIMTTDQGAYRVYDRRISRDGAIVNIERLIEIPLTDEKVRIKGRVNCSSWTIQSTKFDDGKRFMGDWENINPGTAGEATAVAMCR